MRSKDDNKKDKKAAASKLKLDRSKLVELTLDQASRVAGGGTDTCTGCPTDPKTCPLGGVTGVGTG